MVKTSNNVSTSKENYTYKFYTSQVYPNNLENPTLKYSDNSKENIALCFSGGGSRALTCAWGQILGLSQENLIDKIRYISSVSGGTWASSIYSYLPSNISDNNLLGDYIKPEDLSINKISSLNKYSLGKVPDGLGVMTIVTSLFEFYIKNGESNLQWFWPFIISEKILNYYNLSEQDEVPWISKKSFSLSEDYVRNYFPNNSPKDNLFYLKDKRPFLVMNNNIMEILNNGRIGNNIVQIPNQVTPIAGGVKGQSPTGQFNGGGLVETYGVCSNLISESLSNNTVNISLMKPYSLIDIVSTSSAFFAEAIAQFFSKATSSGEIKKTFITRLEASISSECKISIFQEISSNPSTFLQGMNKDILEMENENALGKSFISDLKDLIKESENEFDKISNEVKKGVDSLILDVEKDSYDVKESCKYLLLYIMKKILNNLSFISNIIPKYNYWSVNKNITNKIMDYTDGGTLDNTGIIGILEQTDTGKNNQDSLKILVFDNTDTPLVKKSNGKIIAGSQVAPLFGINFDKTTGEYREFFDDEKDFNSKNFNSISLLHVFENKKYADGNTDFSKLINGLYNSNCGSNPMIKGDDAKAKTAPAYVELNVTTVENSLSSVTGGRNISMLYLQNCIMTDWQNKIGDEKLRKDIESAQEKGDILSDILNILEIEAEYNNFPYYNTFAKIGLNPKESQALCQMWAWAISENSNLVNQAIKNFICSK